MNTGSPPRVREKRNTDMDFTEATGITPACAGKTHIFHGITKIIEDHPRVCGKNEIFTTIFKAILGSPPRVREKH